MLENPLEKQDTKACLRDLPAVDELIRYPVVAQSNLPRRIVVEAVRELVAKVRSAVKAGGAVPDAVMWDRLLQERLQQVERRLFTRVINATGVVLHTNLGRAPLSASALAAVTEIAHGYNNLEYDIEKGERGSRHVHGEAMLKLLTGAEAAMVVNNGAAAILLVLSALASGKEVILSRGEMIEIGGSFRVPDIMVQSGCRLVEVGTTNRTHLSDYASAITSDTGAILKVHSSNYRISGFTASVNGRDLATLAHKQQLPLIEDLGSGVLLDTSKFGMLHEPSIQETLAGGVDVVTCSGDKLLGGPQAGLILGKAEFINRCKRHPLARALRVGKLTLAALQATLADYLRGEAESSIPIWWMCSLSAEQIGARARALARSLEEYAQRSHIAVTVDVVPGESAVGGGSLPGETLPTQLLAVKGTGSWSAQRMAEQLRRAMPPIIGRVEDGQLRLDLRTVDPTDDSLVLQQLQAVLDSPQP